MKQSLLRILIPLAAIAIGALFAVSVLRTNAPTPPPPAATQPAQAPAATTPAAAAEPVAVIPETPAATEPATQPQTRPAQTQASSFDNLHVEQVEIPADQRGKLVSIGSNDPASHYVMRVDFTYFGAAINQISLTDYNTEAMKDGHYVVVTPLEANGYKLYPFAARAVAVNGGKPVDLQSARWEQVGPAKPDRVSYRIRVLDSDNQPVVEIIRTYNLVPGSYDLHCDQRLINRTQEKVQVVWEQNAQGDLPLDAGIDQRVLVAGYFNLTYNPTRTHIYTDQSFLSRVSVLNAMADKQVAFWPNVNLAGTNTELAWVASVNRYFTAVTHPVVVPPATAGAAWTPEAWFNPQSGMFATLGQQVIGDRNKDPQLDTRRLVFTLTSRPFVLPPGKSRDLDLALYAGPRKSEVFAEPPFAALDFGKLIVYSLSCTFCTFQPVAKALLMFLKGIHTVVRDWGVAIIVLVLLVRLVLHPITKRSQISMTKMGKQMQSLQPEIEKLKKKYKDDSATLNTETMKLYREKGVNPANMLGCLPMALQMPIWVALYAMLYFAIELRHQPAFYGIFQKISGGHWAFLADLSAPDNFIQFHGGGFDLPLLIKTVHVSGINMLPVFMGIVYYFQQQLMAVPPANEQAAQQQKMMKWMILLFPIMLYSSPSGLNLYILASTAGGIVDSLIVRRHIKREEEAGTLFKPRNAAADKPGGWRQRLQESLESRQRAIEERQRREQKRK